MRALLLLLLLPGCLAQQLDRMKDQAAAGQTAALAAERIECSGPDALCAQAQVLRAEACLTLARSAPRDAAAPAHRACAASGYAAALAALPPGGRERRTLLAGLAAAAMDRRDAGEASPDAQLGAGLAMLKLDPGDAIGCTHARSARLARALLGPAGMPRCAELRAAPACRATPALDREIAAQTAASCPQEPGR